MREGSSVSGGGSCGVDEGGVGELVEEDEVACLGDGGEQGEVGGVAGAEEEGGFGVFEGGEGVFGFAVWGEVAYDETASAGSDAEALDGLCGGVDESGVLAESEVVVGSDVEELSAIACEEGSGGLNGAEGSVEVLGAPLLELMAELVLDGRVVGQGVGGSGVESSEFVVIVAVVGIDDGEFVA